MLSILIPTYNYNVFPLVENLFNQCEKEGIKYEIIVVDDGSQKQFDNDKINSLKNCSFKVLKKNIGLSSIRNLLIKTSEYEWILLLDADVFPVNENYISEYIQAIKKNNYNYFSGGIQYKTDRPENDKILRWKYGKKREALTFEQRKNGKSNYTNVNILLHKAVFNEVMFEEKVRFYGYEDVIFSTKLLQYFSVFPVDNPVYHLDESTSEDFLNKSETALQTLHFLIQNNLIQTDKVKIAKIYVLLKKWNLTFLIRFFYGLFRKPVKRNLLSSNPNLFLFDLYRLGYICSL